MQIDQKNFAELRPASAGYGKGEKQTNKDKEKNKMKKYVKPQLVSKTEPQRSFVAGCPAKGAGTSSHCHDCERTK